jgi:hypothetical protein
MGIGEAKAPGLREIVLEFIICRRCCYVCNLRVIQSVRNEIRAYRKRLGYVGAHLDAMCRSHEGYSI